MSSARGIKAARVLLDKGIDESIVAALKPVRDPAIARLVDSLGAGDKRRILRSLAPERCARVLRKVSDFSRESFLGSLAFVDLKNLLGGAESELAVDIIQSLDPRRKAKVIAELKKTDPRGLLPLLVFPPESAGGLMRTNALTARGDQTVDEVKVMLGKEISPRQKSHYLYVSDATGTLVGAIPLLRLLQAPSGDRLSDLALPGAVILAPETDQEEVAKAFDEHDIIEAPVVVRGKVLGVIAADDIYEVMRREHGEDIARLAGVNADAHIGDPIGVSVQRRLPWLIVNLATAVLAASVVSRFQDTIARIAIIAAFMPIVAGMGGNAAQQVLGLTVRAIAFNELREINVLRAIAREIMIGTFNGFFTGSVMGILAYLWIGNPILAFVIVFSLTFNLLIAGVGGMAVPLIMRALRIDPALASTVFVTTLTDVGGFFVLLGLSSRLL